MLALGWKDATIVVKEKQSFSAGQVEWQLGWGHFGSRLLPLCCFHGGGGCPSRAAMFPAVAAAMAMDKISDMTAHFRVEEELWSAFTQEVGAPGDDPRLLAALPGKLVAAALSQASLPGGRPLSAILAAQVGLVWKLARRIMYTKGGGLWEDWTEEDPWDAPSTTSPSKRTATSSKKDDKDTKERTLKFAQVLDQGDDGEFEVLNEDDKLLLLQKYINTTGSMPEEEEEPTIEQLSALKKKLSLGKPPYADFGVFVPFGRKALRASKYRTWVPTADGYVSKELPGPSNFTQWRACYRVFTTAMIMLLECSLAPLHGYELFVEKMVRLYPDAWHLVYAADEMARSELLSRLRLKINMCTKEGRAPPPHFDESKPWEGVFKMIPNELKFWQDQIHGPALAWLANGSKGRAQTPQETIAQGSLRGGAEALLPAMESGTFGTTSPSAPSSSRRQVNRDRKEAKKRKLQAEREELQRLRESRNDGGFERRQGGKSGGKQGRGGKQVESICFSWNNGNAPCGSLPPGAECLNTVKRMRNCSSCRSPGHPQHKCAAKT